MARVARVEAFSSEEIATIHVMNRVVRRCFLMREKTGTHMFYRGNCLPGWVGIGFRFWQFFE